MQIDRKIVEQALEALECCTPKSQYYSNQQLGDAITSLRTALEQPQSEPVGYIWNDLTKIGKIKKCIGFDIPHYISEEGAKPLFTTPPDAAAQIAALTKQRDELLAALEQIERHTEAHYMIKRIARAAIAQVKEQT